MSVEYTSVVHQIKNPLQKTSEHIYIYVYIYINIYVYIYTRVNYDISFVIAFLVNWYISPVILTWIASRERTIIQWRQSVENIWENISKHIAIIKRAVVMAFFFVWHIILPRQFVAYNHGEKYPFVWEPSRNYILYNMHSMMII